MGSKKKRERKKEKRKRHGRQSPSGNESAAEERPVKGAAAFDPGASALTADAADEWKRLYAGISDIVE